MFFAPRGKRAVSCALRGAELPASRVELVAANAFPEKLEAWELLHRLRDALKRDMLARKLRGRIEVDETYIGGRQKGKRGRGAAHKSVVIGLVARHRSVSPTHLQRYLIEEDFKHRLPEDTDFIALAACRT